MYRALYFARNKADKRNPLEQCQDLAEHLKDTGFDIWVMGSNQNELIFYGKDIDDTWVVFKSILMDNCPVTNHPTNSRAMRKARQSMTHLKNALIGG